MAFTFTTSTGGISTAEFPAAFKVIRQRKKLTQAQCAEFLWGVHVSVYRKWEMGETTPSDRYWTKIKELYEQTKGDGK